ncbi:MAG: lycopene cyclase domain-containing protein [Pseudomonadota bacterium]
MSFLEGLTYLGFHAIFTLPLLVALFAWPPRPFFRDRSARIALGLIVLIAFVYTTPWDNYLVYRNVWGYPPERVIARIGYVPIEEYMFFVIQTLMTGLWYLHLRARIPIQNSEFSIANSTTNTAELVRRVGIGFFLVLSALGFWFVLGAPDQALYMGLILAWACPVLAGMWYLGGHWMWEQRRWWLPAVIVPTLYLWWADRTAIALDIWDISNTYSFDIDPLGLPIEEATFFLVTNLLVVQGMTLFLHDTSPVRRSNALVA